MEKLFNRITIFSKITKINYPFSVIGPMIICIFKKWEETKILIIINENKSIYKSHWPRKQYQSGNIQL